MNLERAIEKAKVIYDACRQVDVPIRAIHSRWGYQPMSGLVLQTVAALKAYGLVVVSGDKDKRVVRISDVAVKILREHPDCEKLIQEAALSPAIYAELWDKYKADGLPPDDILGNYLEWEKDFNPKAIAGFITDYRATIDFAKLTPTGIMGDNDDGGSDGDDDAPETEGEKPPKKNTTGTPPPKPKRAELPGGEPGMASDTWTIGENIIVFQYPRQLNAVEYRDLEDWMMLQLRKIKRLVKTDPQDDKKDQATQEQ
jgi:hypothetical protein